MQNALSGAFCNVFDLHLATICHKDLFNLFLSGRFTSVLLYLSNKQPIQSTN